MIDHKRFRVLQIIPNLERGGAERTVVDLVRLHDRSQVEAAVCVLQDIVPGDYSPELESINIPLFALKAGPGPKPGVIIDLIRVIRSFCPNVVHTHLNALKYAWFAARALRVPIIHTLHSLPGREPWVDRLVNRVLFGVRGISWVAVSRTTHQMLLNSGLLDMKRLYLIPNGIDLSRFRSLPARDDLRLRYSLPIGASIGISVGALRPEKII